MAAAAAGDSTSVVVAGAMRAATLRVATFIEAPGTALAIASCATMTISGTGGALPSRTKLAAIHAPTTSTFALGVS